MKLTQEQIDALNAIDPDLLEAFREAVEGEARAPWQAENAKLMGLLQRLLDEYDENMTREPSFVTMELVRDALTYKAPP